MMRRGDEDHSPSEPTAALFHQKVLEEGGKVETSPDIFVLKSKQTEFGACV